MAFWAGLVLLAWCASPFYAVELKASREAVDVDGDLSVKQASSPHRGDSGGFKP